MMRGDTRFLYDIIDTTFGKCIKFNVVKAVCTVCDAFDLTEAGKYCSLSFAITIDGAQLVKGLTVMIAGLKVMDIAARLPISGKHLVNGCFDNVQSWNLCIPLMIALAQEIMEVNEVFEDMFSFSNS